MKAKEVWCKDAKDFNKRSLTVEVEQKKFMDNNKVLKSFVASSAERLKGHYLLLTYREGVMNVLGSIPAISFYAENMLRIGAAFGPYINEYFARQESSIQVISGAIMIKPKVEKIKYVRGVLGQKFSKAVEALGRDEKKRKRHTHVPWKNIKDSGM